jgi:hypothetical protein
MKLARKDRSLTAWMLYFSILISAFACAHSHGQMASLQLIGLDVQYCSLDGTFNADAELEALGIIPLKPTTGSNCALASLFCATILAAFFGLLGLLVAERMRPLPTQHLTRIVRYRWPPANPRASPTLLPVL